MIMLEILLSNNRFRVEPKLATLYLNSNQRWSKAYRMIILNSLRTNISILKDGDRPL